MQELNLLLALTTCVVSLYVCVIMFWWWRRLAKSQSKLRSFIFDVGMAKAALCFWAATGVFQIMAIDMTQPLITLPCRIVWMLVVIRQALTTLKYYDVPDDDLDPRGPFQ